MTRYIPGARGLRLGDSALINQVEADQARLNSTADQDGWIVSIVGDNVFCQTDTIGVTTTSFGRLFRVPDRQRDVTATEARITVVTPNAGDTLMAALYRYADKQFFRIPGSLVTFDAGVSGLQIITLKNPIKISAEMNLFVGTLTSSATPVFEGFARSVVSKVIRGRIMPSASLTEIVSLSQMNISTTSDIPLVAYLSARAAAVL